MAITVFSTTAEAKSRYNVGGATLSGWRKHETFPKKATKGGGRGKPTTWDLDAIDKWLKKRPVTKGPKPRWLAVVGHKQAA